jgi:hypothetical protein
MNNERSENPSSTFRVPRSSLMVSDVPTPDTGLKDPKTTHHFTSSNSMAMASGPSIIAARILLLPKL